MIPEHDYILGIPFTYLLFILSGMCLGVIWLIASVFVYAVFGVLLNVYILA